jgi:flagellar hook-associated protein 2
MSSVSSAFNSNGLNFSGLASGIDSSKIIEGLTAFNQRRIDQLNAQKQNITLRQATTATLQAKVIDFQLSLGRLGRSVAGAFDARKVTNSDTDAVTATAGSSAVPGTYTLTVASLAQAQSVASAGFSDAGARIKEGTFSFRVGSGETKTVTIGSANNSVQGLADAINNAGGEVRASVINDGSANPYRLMLTATKTGAANTIQLTNNLTGGTGADINPAATTVQAAADATVQLGSGAGAITVNSPTNQVNTLIPGVSLALTTANPAKPLTINVSHDTEGASKAVQDFVTSYNQIVDFIDERDDYTQEGNQAGTLLGNRDVADLQGDLANALTSAVPGVKSAANRLSSIGITFNEKGRLQIDQGKLDRAIAGQESGVTIGDVKRLFAFTGSSNNNGVSFLLGSDKTKPSAAGQPYRVNVTAPATRGSVTAGSPPAPSVTIDNTNNTFAVVVNGVRSTTLSLAAGTYTPSALAAALQSVINSDPPLQGNQVSVDLSSGQLRITAARYGSGSTVEVESGTALSALGFTSGQRGVGGDVSGNFVVNGQTEQATGSGQFLTGSSGNANTEGLQLLVTAGVATTADLDVTQGIASRLSGVLQKYMDPVNGRFGIIDKGYASSTADIDKAITRQNEQMDAKKESLLKQFAAMESAVNKLKGLGTQLASLFTTAR